LIAISLNVSECVVETDATCFRQPHYNHTLLLSDTHWQQPCVSRTSHLRL